MPSYYPVYLNLKGRRCVIVGGGAEAQRKAQGLVECRAKVTVINPTVTVVLQDLANRGLINWLSREYQAGDLEGVFLAIAENDRPRVYMEVAKEAERRGVMLNVVDTTNLCSFIAPAIVRRGDVTFAISTAGLSPALARRLREELSESPVLRWADMADMLSEVRLSLRRKGVRPDPERWQECMDNELLDLFHDGRQDEARERLLRMLQEQPRATQETRA
ncbi:MAG: bifunctional precorrin-2 dehydrogenase/sirohydrochlorin ferrochelatase [Dehalococcoidia bacterium]|nr:bifunctional precorrin-2 dehydrogenase/sirohydrochlorin ferrochelatase [Dehalococcoidia bacterium]